MRDQTGNGCATDSRLQGERREGDVTRIAEALAKSGRVTLRVRGTSMLPCVRPGDIAVIQQVSTEGVRCGDVVLFRKSDFLLVHRIVDRKASLSTAKFYAKGDSHRRGDGEMASRELLGRVVRLYRGGKRIDLDSPGQLALGLLMSKLSKNGTLWYPVADLIARAMFPVRRVLQTIRPAGAVSR